jgi:hypothetical protein
MELRGVVLCLFLGNTARCCILVCELMPGHHGNEIAAAEATTGICEA